MPKNGDWLNGPFVDTGQNDKPIEGEKENES